jgi:hypothetical protein
MDTLENVSNEVGSLHESLRQIWNFKVKTTTCVNCRNELAHKPKEAIR